MYLGEFISSQEAVDLGMISRVTEKDALYDTGLEMAKKMAGRSPLVLRLTKEAINMNLDAGGMEQALNMEDRNQVLLSMASGIISTV